MLKIDMNSANTIVFVSFESEFAPCGGLTAVMRKLPREMAKTFPDKKVILIAPFFGNISKTSECFDKNQMKLVKSDIPIKFNMESIFFDILAYPNLPNDVLKEPVNFTLYLIRSTQFFTASVNPYINSDDLDGKKLLKDALFLDATIPLVLALIPRPGPFIINLQDWETASVANLFHVQDALTESKKIHAKCVLTIHNPYDHPLILENGLKTLKVHEMLNLPAPSPNQFTIMQYALPYITKVSTVSSHFAYELTHDPLHTDAFAPHLQKYFQSHPVIGIENGFFHSTQFPTEIQSVNEILTYKKQQRRKFINIITSSTGQTMVSKAWGKCDLSNASLPIFHIFGRDDPRQKGYDVCSEIIRKLLEKHGDNYARFIFTPIPGPHGIHALNYLKNLCNKFPDSVLTFPFKMTTGYLELQAAATYLVMPSLYEPFGAANEGYSVGVPVIARATGGLLQQIDPVNFADLPSEIQSFVEQYHGTERNPTGFLYREKQNGTHQDDWKAIVSANYLKSNPLGDPVDERKNLNLFGNMVDAGMSVIEQAIEYFNSKPAKYAHLILNGVNLLHKFSWTHAVDGYSKKLYN